MRSIALFAALALMAFLAGGASGQTDAGLQTQSEIVVTGVRPEQVQAFVERVAAVPPSVNQIARWNEDICLSLVGLSPEQGQSIVDRVSYRAEAVGLSAGRAGCRPNVFVFFANDADAFTRELVEQRRSLFAVYHEESVATLGQSALTAFIDTPRPVRWWHVSQTLAADGDRLGSDASQTAAGPPPRPEEMRATPDGFSGAQVVRSEGTRVRAVERQDFNRAIIIVDGRRAAGYPVDGVADYIAMVTLAQIDPQAQTRDYATILNLFSEDADIVSFEMTNWDTAYLAALYRSTRNSASVTQQVREIARRMSGD